MAIISLMAGKGMAQVENLALRFGETGRVDCGVMPEMDDKESYSLQFWIKPERWNPGAVVMGLGDNGKIMLGKPGEICFRTEGKEISLSSPDLQEGVWSQITIIVSEGKGKALVNGEFVGEEIVGRINGSEKNNIKNKGSEGLSFSLGGGFVGVLDEVRIWNAALNDEMAIFDYFTNNTLNKWNPMWNNLVAYYKMDDKGSSGLRDYKSVVDFRTNQGIKEGKFTGEVERISADNPGLPYLVNAAYTSNDQFFSAGIPLEQYLLHNELIILGTDVYAEDGRIEVKTPNNHAVSLTGVKYLPEFEGRKGVVSIDGKEKSGVEIPVIDLQDERGFTFATWICLEEINKTANIFRHIGEEEKENDMEIGIFEDEGSPLIRVRYLGCEYLSEKLPLNPKTWTNLTVTGDQEDVALYMNGEKYSLKMSDLNRSALKRDGIKGINGDSSDKNGIKGKLGMRRGFIGEGFHGKMDETVILNKHLEAQEIAVLMENVPAPGIGKEVSRDDMRTIQAYYRYDSPDNPGYDSHSQDEWLNIMKGAYKDREGVRFYISVQGTYNVREKFGDWREILDNPAKRNRFVEDLAAISENYDGVELDLEWLEHPEQWEDFGILCQEIKEGLPEGKEFRVSLHNNFTAFPADKMKYVDGFTFQQYGPNPNNFKYSNFLGNVKKFEKSFEKDKIYTSYATTTSRGVNGARPSGVRWGMLEDYTPGDQDVDTYSNGEETWDFIGPMQVYRRAKHTREENLPGIFYWDMGNDNWDRKDGEAVMPKYNLAKYSTYGINANTEKP